MAIRRRNLRARVRAGRTPGRGGCGEERGERAHHDVEAAEELDGLVDRSLDIRLLAHIGFERGGLDVGETLLDERERLLGCGEVNVDEEDVRTLLREQER